MYIRLCKTANTLQFYFVNVVNKMASTDCKALLTFASNTSIDIPSTKHIDEVLIDMTASIIYRFEGETKWLYCKGNEFIESQTLNMTIMDEHNNVKETINIPGTVTAKTDAITNEKQIYCSCSKCKQLMENYKHIEDEATKQQTSMEQQTAKDYHVEQKHEIVDVIVIDDNEPIIEQQAKKRIVIDNKPIIEQQAAKKRVHWKDRLDILPTILNDEEPANIIKRKYRRNLRHQTLRRSSRIAEQMSGR